MQKLWKIWNPSSVNDVKWTTFDFWTAKIHLHTNLLWLYMCVYIYVPCQFQHRSEIIDYSRITYQDEKKKIMEGTGKHAVTVMVMMMALLLWGCLMMMSGAEAHIEKGGCLEGCLEGCKHSGISPLRCLKYCAKHCGSLSPSFAAGGHKQQRPAPPPPPAGHHYCNLGCMFQKCSKFHDGT